MLLGDGSAWDMPQELPQGEGPDHFLSATVLEMGQRNVYGASLSAASAHLF